MKDPYDLAKSSIIDAEKLDTYIYAMSLDRKTVSDGELRADEFFESGYCR